MDFITQQREYILSTNTAQDRLKDILNLLNTTTTKININDSLDGDLDFSILSELGFNKVSEITFISGNILSINNLPKGLQILNCSNNLLIDLEPLPVQIEILNISNNYLTNLDISYLKNLKVLNVDSNKITDLGKLPKTLEELNCESNKLELLNLIDVPDLKVLSISNNLITVIENLPKNLVTFHMENTPSIEFRNTSINNINITTDKKDKNDKLDYDEALQKYFNFKNKYEDTRRRKLRSIYNNESKNKRKKLIRSFKMPCIYCKRLVNTAFIHKDDKYIAICGDNNMPCELAITIYNGQFTSLTELINDEKEDLLDIQNIIIEQKMDNLFNYMDEDNSNILFNKQLTAYNTSSKIFNKLLDKYNEIANNEKTKTEISDLKKEIFKHKENYNDLYNNYKETNNRQLLKDAMAIYVNELLPKVNQIKLLTYQIYEKKQLFSYPKKLDEEMMEECIFSYPFLLNKTETNLAEEPDVIKFIID